MNTNAGRLRIGSLCTGTGGLDMAVTAVLDAELAWVCDNDPAAAALLAHHYPDVPNHSDLTATDWALVEPVDVLTAGFPCQDVSSAGLRAGLRDGNRSGLWLHIADIIDQLRPSLVVLENVRGLLSAEADSALELCPWCVGDGPGTDLRALGAVLGDLADLGFDAEWCVLPASDVGAPHRRERVFIVARPAGHPQMLGRHEVSASGRGDRPEGPAGGPGSAAADTAGVEWGEGRPEPARVVGGPDVAVGGDVAPDWAGYRPAIRRWERILGRPAPAPTVLGRRGGRQLSAHFVEWLQGLPEGWVTDVPGLSRNQQLKLLGNGCVPLQCEAALRHLLPLLTEMGVAA